MVQVNEEVIYFDSWGRPKRARVVAIRPAGTLDLSVGTPTHPELANNISHATRVGQETMWLEITPELEATLKLDEEPAAQTKASKSPPPPADDTKKKSDAK